MTAAERLVRLTEGKDPMMIRRMRSGFAVMSNTQFLEGYSLLIAYPEVPNLNALSMEARTAFLTDMTVLGDAIQRATECDRVNYGIYGNMDRYLHAHIVPRYETEPEHLRHLPPLSYPADIREAPIHAYSPDRHLPLLEDIILMLSHLGQ